MPRCLFCDFTGKLTHEHALPGWIAKQFQLRGEFMEVVEMFGEKAVAPKQNVSIASHRKRNVCERCNTHFKHLEDRALPILVSMGHGYEVTLTLEQQATLAEWGAKTAVTLVAIEKGGETAVPEAQRHSIRQTGRPPDGWWIGYCPWAGVVRKFVEFGEVRDEDSMDSRSYIRAVAAFAKVAFLAYGYASARSDDAFVADPMFTPVWPQQEASKEWPSGLAYTQRSFRALIANPLLGTFS